MTKLIIKSIPQHPNEKALPFLHKTVLHNLRLACPITLEVEIGD
jgi:hypothetical protein